MGTTESKAKAGVVSSGILDRMVIVGKPEPHDFCVKCEKLVCESDIEWVDDQPYCPKCYGQLPEPDVDAEDLHLESERERELER